MPDSNSKYMFERLGDHDFQQLVAALLAHHFSDFTPMALRQSDGGRDGLRNVAGRPIVYQVKWSSNGRDKDPVRWLDAAVAKEADNLKRLADEGANRYILVTNVPSTGKPKTGTFDRLNERLAAHAKTFGFEEMSCAWREAVNGWVDNAPDTLKWAYADMLAGWDLIRYLVAEQVGASRDSQLRSLIRKVAAFQWEEDERVKFSQVDVDRERVADLFVDVHAERILTTAAARTALPLGPVGGAAQYLLHTAAPFTLVRGAPGQGKSTLSQYVSQAHRAAFVPEDQRPTRLPAQTRPKFPIRCDLSDYSRFLAGLDPWEATDDRPRKTAKLSGQRASLEAFLASFMSHASGGIPVDVEVIHDLFSRVPTLVVLDGLDEVGSPSLRRRVVKGIDGFVSRAGTYDIPPRVIVTSRPSGGSLPEPSLTAFEAITLEALTNDQRSEYLRRWCSVRDIRAREGRSLRKNFQEKSKEPFIEELAGNPMQLTILLDLLHRQGMATSTQRTDLYNDYVQLLLAREANKYPDVVRRHKDELLEMIPFLGWYLQAHAEESPLNQRMNLADLRAAMAHFQRTYGNPESVVDELFTATADRLWALTSKTEGSYEFEVLSLREYFAARFLYRNAGEDQPDFDKAAVLQQLLRRPYWLNTARFYAGNAKGGDLYLVAAAIEDELRGPPHPASYLAAWALLSDGVFARRPREARRVLTALCSDAGIPILLDALRRRDISPLPQLPQPEDEGPDPTWHRLTVAIQASPDDAQNPERVKVLRDLLNAKAAFADWWQARALEAAGTPSQSAWLSLAAQCEGAAGLALDFPRDALTHGDAENLLSSGVVPAAGSALETELITAVKNGECPSVTSIRSFPAQLAIAFSPLAFVCSGSGAFTDAGGRAGRRRSDAVQQLRRRDAKLAEAARLRTFRRGEKGSTFPWANTASALFEELGQNWLATEIAVLGAASPFQLGYTRRDAKDAFGAKGHPAELMAGSRSHAADQAWWEEQLQGCSDDYARAEWALALWGIADGPVLDALFAEWERVVQGIERRWRITLLAACERLCDSKWLAKRQVTTAIDDPVLNQLVVRRRLGRTAPSPSPSIQPEPDRLDTLAPLITVARSKRWLKVDTQGFYR